MWRKNKQSFNPIFDLGGRIWRKLFHLYVIRTELDIYACIKTHMFISIGITICYWNKNLIIQFSGHDAFWNNLHQVRSQSKDWKAKQFRSVVGVIKLKGLNRIAQISYGHQYLKEEDLSFDEEKYTLWIHPYIKVYISRTRMCHQHAYNFFL